MRKHLKDWPCKSLTHTHLYYVKLWYTLVTLDTLELRDFLYSPVILEDAEPGHDYQDDDYYYEEDVRETTAFQFSKSTFGGDYVRDDEDDGSDYPHPTKPVPIG